MQDCPNIVIYNFTHSSVCLCLLVTSAVTMNHLTFFFLLNFNRAPRSNSYRQRRSKCVHYNLVFAFRCHVIQVKSGLALFASAGVINGGLVAPHESFQMEILSICIRMKRWARVMPVSLSHSSHQNSTHIECSSLFSYFKSYLAPINWSFVGRIIRQRNNEKRKS